MKFLQDLLVYLFSAGTLGGLLIWLFQRRMAKVDEMREEKEEAREGMLRMMMRDAHATYILSVATARAVQRIPDAKCNGDMTKALQEAEVIQREETDFLLNYGIEHIFGK